MISAFLAKYSLIVRIALGATLLALVWLVAMTRFFGAVDKIEQRGWEAGKTHIEVKVQDQVLQNVSTANDTRQSIDAQTAAGRGAELHAQCLRSARNPENCKRFLPD